MNMDNILENERKEKMVLQAVYELSKPEKYQGVDEKIVASHTGLTVDEAKDILTKLQITYQSIDQPFFESGYISNALTKTKLLEYERLTPQSSTHTTNNFHGSVGAFQSGNYNVANITQNNYLHKSLTEAAKEIQQLLDQLTQDYPINTQLEKITVVGKAIEQIENDPSWKARLISAFKSGGIEALKELLDNPVANIFLATVEGWQEAK
ncbi:MAG: hypothetical protein IM542_01650 [Pseudanabaena sp. M165S2SP1A06QC]|jgi:Asp/Glu/hydantoin racemase|nr:hypothetical protein [Pseudanabaena sp. M109S1SP2A07QC]MCA6621296.1 hypothetical protein [Pseudanabaena sp. M165S2SP1A06QC]